MAKKPKKLYATTKNPTILAIVEGRYSFLSLQDAEDFLEQIKQRFVVSTHSKEHEGGRHSLYIWIKGYQITEDEKKQNYTGNFALLQAAPNDKGKFHIQISKIESELKHHPQRKYPKQSHPNWGHPVLRSIKRGKIYSTLEFAQSELQLLQEEYPKTSVPTQNKLYLMLFEYNEALGKKGVIKYVFEIKAAPADKNGGFIIAYNMNKHQKPRKKPEIGAKDSSAKTTKELKEEGYYTSMVKLKKSRKKPPPAGNDEGQKQ